jgi:hypothetical protein
MRLPLRLAPATVSIAAVVVSAALVRTTHALV